MNFEDNVNLNPELTWADCAAFIYDGVVDGKLSRADFIKFFVLSGQEMCEPRHARIFAKALASFFKRDYSDLRSDEKPGVFVIVDNKKYIVSPKEDKEVTIESAKDLNESDCSFLILYETASDAKIGAWENKEKYVERIKRSSE